MIIEQDTLAIFYFFRLQMSLIKKKKYYSNARALSAQPTSFNNSIAIYIDFANTIFFLHFF